MNYLKRINPTYLFILPVIISILFFIYSYFWIDHGLVTFLSANRPAIGYFFKLIEFTSNNKVLMAELYFILIIFMFIFQLIFFIPNIYRNINLKPFILILGLMTLIYS